MISRRMFFAGSAGIVIRGRGLVLEAIAAENMPHRIVVRGVAPSAFFELRDYGPASTEVANILAQRGVPAVIEDRGRLLFAFESLAMRERAWREAGPFESAPTQIAIYRQTQTASS